MSSIQISCNQLAMSCITPSIALSTVGDRKARSAYVTLFPEMFLLMKPAQPVVMTEV